VLYKLSSLVTFIRRFCLLAAAIALLLAGPAAVSFTAQGRARVPAQALARIEAALRDKHSRTPTERKIDSRLLHEVKRRTGEALAAPATRTGTDIRYAPDGHVVVDVKARINNGLLAALNARGIEVLASDRNRSMLRAHIAIDRVRELADMPGVTFVQPQQQAITWRQMQTNLQVALHGAGLARGEGDVAHLAHVSRKAFSVDGTGIKIGVLSDGVNNLAASQASGDLGAVTVVPGQAGSGDEGTAMLEIVHELAPGAQLFFATATGLTGPSGFADNIRTLRNTYECDIIIDDVFYFAESPFHDGQPVASSSDLAAITQAVNDVTAAGALYFSSAGNSGNFTAGTSSVWEGDFLDGGSGGMLGLPGRLHDFGGGQTYNVVTGFGPATTLHWADPIGGSANDYDIFAFDDTFTLLFDASTNFQTGAEDPFEIMSSFPGDHVVIVKADGGEDRFLHLSGVGATLQTATPGAIQGHAGAASAFAIAATPANQAFPFPFQSTSPIETFSSDGPRRVFYQANGTPYTPGNFLSAGGTLRQKPDITAADAVRVTGVGGFPSSFFGTSAAAPHAGAIAALVLAKNPALTPAQVRTAITTTAIDIGLAGVDRDSGAGIVMADAALRSISSPSAALAPMNIYAYDGPGEVALLNGSPEAGEGGYISVDLGNWGSTTATGITATLSSSTSGITVRQQQPSTFADLATRGTGFATNTPLFFTVASTFPCPQSASFTLTVNSNAGPQVFNFDVAIGPPAYQIFGEALDATAPAAQTGMSTATGIQTQRLVRTGIPSTCGTTPPPPSLFLDPGGQENPNRRFDAYSFNSCTTSVPSCVTVSLGSSNGLFSAAYAPAFNQFDVTQNYKGDIGASGGLRSYSFDTAGAGQSFAIDVHQVDGNVGLGEGYFLTVEGACGGTCAPPNRVPVATANNVTVTADHTGFAFVSMDDIIVGTFDPDGDQLFISLDNYGPYPIGQTTVLLTVTDTRGAASQASAIITVTPQPVVSIADVSVTEGDFGTVNANFVVTLSGPSTLPVGVDAFTVGGTAVAPSDFVDNAQFFLFQPGEVSKTFTVLVNGDITAEADETFSVLLAVSFNTAIADGLAVGTIQNDDIAVTEAAVTQAVLNGATRLQQLQRADGGWYFRVGDTDCRAGAGVSCPNTVGITALGLLAGHTRTGNASMLTSAVAAGDYLVARYNATTASVPAVLPASQDVEFLVELGAKTGNAVYTTTAANWFQRIVANYTATAYVDRLIAVRGNFAPIGVWNVGSFIRSAKSVGNMPYAVAAAVHVTSPAVEALWKDTNPSHRWDMCGNPNGCGAPSNPFGYDYTLVAMGTLLNAIHDITNLDSALPPKIGEYGTHLLNAQDVLGSWDVGDTQITAYVVLGLASVNGPPSVIEAAVNWFVNYQQPLGGWPAYATGLLQGAEYTELDAEAVRAIFTLYNTPEGEGVVVAPAQLSSVTFSEVTESGRTSVVGAEVPAGTTPSPGVEVLNNLAYDVTTTASFSGLTTVCFAVPSVTSSTDFANVRLLHKEGNVLVDRTILGSGVYAPNFENRRVCGEVTSLSPFAIGVLDTTPPEATVTLSPPLIAADSKNIVKVTASITVSDNTDPSPTVTLVSITSSEPDKGLGKGDNPNDIHNAKLGTDDREFNLRAEHFIGVERVYTVVYRVADRYGNSRDVSSRVVVR
jgi:hypothetical protein